MDAQHRPPPVVAPPKPVGPPNILVRDPPLWPLLVGLVMGILLALLVIRL